MSTHIIHITNSSSKIGVDRGCLTCKTPNSEEKRVPLSDILAIIVASIGVSFSGEAISRLIENNVIILHCNHKFQPIGKTIGLNHLVHIDLFENQIKLDKELNNKLWEKVLLGKILNQAYVLDLIEKTHKIHEYVELDLLDEGNIARHYFKKFFKEFGRKAPKIREHEGALSPINSMLNYVYAVLSSILHRSIIIHGLHSSLGIHHKYRFKSEPLVYDLVEPLRALGDLILLKYHKKYPRREIETFVKYAAENIINSKISFDGKKFFSLINAIDVYVSSIASFYKTCDINLVKIPTLKGIKLED